MLPGGRAADVTAPRPAAEVPVRHHRAVPPTAPEPTEACPGCGAVLVQVEEAGEHPGASGSCARLFEVTLHGLREQAVTDPGAAAAVAAADAAYDAQHPDAAAPGRLRAALATLGAPHGDEEHSDAPDRPKAWRTTIADVAADLDVIDLPALIDSWASAVAQDWTSASTTSR
jgi:hypothetical protein